MKFSFPELDAKKIAAVAVTLVTVSFWLVIANYPTAYLFNPLDTKLTVFRVEQIFSSLGWVLYSVFPLVFAWVTQLNGKSTKMLYMISVVLWPLAIFVIQITLIFYGGGFYAYLGKHPIFALNDVIAPLVLLALSSTLFATKAAKRTKQSRSR